MGYRPLRMPAMACDTMPDPAFPMHHELVVTAFLCFVWALEKVFLRYAPPAARCVLLLRCLTRRGGVVVVLGRLLGASPLLGQVVAGVVAGPALLDLVPFTACFKFVGKMGGTSDTGSGLWPLPTTPHRTVCHVCDSPGCVCRRRQCCCW